MKRSNLQVQADLFGSTPARSTTAALQLHHDELVDLVSRLLREVVQAPTTQATKERVHEQDHR